MAGEVGMQSKERGRNGKQTESGRGREGDTLGRQGRIIRRKGGSGRSGVEVGGRDE